MKKWWASIGIVALALAVLASHPAGATGGVDAADTPSTTTTTAAPTTSTTTNSTAPATPVVPAPAPAPLAAQNGYWVLGSDGGVFTFGGVTFNGSAAPLHLASPFVAAAATRSGHGYWLVTADGGVFTLGDARFAGSAAGAGLGVVVALLPTPSEHGYWLVTTRGRIANYGDAPLLTAAIGAAPVVAAAATPTGKGVWLADIAGAVYAAGDAVALPRPDGSGPESARPLVGIAATPTGHGYWLVYLDGTILPVGDAANVGTLAGVPLAAPIVGVIADADGGGLLLVGADGGVFRFGTAPYAGSAAPYHPANTIMGVLMPGTSTSSGTALMLGYFAAKTFSLTFDDGPNPQFTPQVLSILEANGVLATFFEIGWEVSAYPQLSAAIAAAGDIVGNHTYTHPFLTRLGADRFDFEIDRTTQLIGQATGRLPRCARPPYGDTNGSVAARLAAKGVPQVMWTVDTSDYKRPPAAAIVANVLANAAPGGVVLMHDGGGDRSQTVAAVQAIIDGLRAEGFTLVPVPRCA